MRKYIRDQNITIQTCESIQNLALNELNRNIIRREGALSIMTWILKSTIKVPQIQKSVLASIANLVSELINANHVIKSDCIPYVLQSMQLHPKDAEVQRHASRLLAYLVACNASVLNDVKGTIYAQGGVDLILSVKENFTDSNVQKTVQVILNCLTMDGKIALYLKKHKRLEKKVVSPTDRNEIKLL